MGLHEVYSLGFIDVPIRTSNADAEKAALEDEIKRAVVELGVSVEGENVKATFVKGRLSWDGKGLEGYAVAHPEVMVFQKQGSPYVRFTYKNK